MQLVAFCLFEVRRGREHRCCRAAGRSHCLRRLGPVHLPLPVRNLQTTSSLRHQSARARVVNVLCRCKSGVLSPPLLLAGAGGHVLAQHDDAARALHPRGQPLHHHQHLPHPAQRLRMPYPVQREGGVGDEQRAGGLRSAKVEATAWSRRFVGAITWSQGGTKPGQAAMRSLRVKLRVATRYRTPCNPLEPAKHRASAHAANCASLPRRFTCSRYPPCSPCALPSWRWRPCFRWGPFRNRLGQSGGGRPRSAVWRPTVMQIWV